MTSILETDIIQKMILKALLDNKCEQGHSMTTFQIAKTIKKSPRIVKEKLVNLEVQGAVERAKQGKTRKYTRGTTPVESKSKIHWRIRC